MSAWAEIVNNDGSDEWLELCNKALSEIKREALARTPYETPSDVPTSLTKRAYNLMGVSQNMYAAVVYDYENARSEEGDA